MTSPVVVQLGKISHGVYLERLVEGIEMTDDLACHFERIARNLSSPDNEVYSTCTATTYPTFLVHGQVAGWSPSRVSLQVDKSFLASLHAENSQCGAFRKPKKNNSEIPS